MSFASPDDVMEVVGGIVQAAIAAATGEPPPAIERMPWHEAMALFGTDKPDIRFGLDLVDLSEAFANTEVRAFQANAIKAIRVPSGANFGRNRLDGLIERAKELGAAGLVWIRVKPEGELEGPPPTNRIEEDERLGLLDATGAQPGDLLLLVAGERRVVEEVLGRLRLDIGAPAVHEPPMRLLWVVDFPLFEAIDDDGRPVPAHHPFTSPHPDDLRSLASAKGDALLDIRSLAYDLVGISPEQAQARFGFLLDAFRYGAPPHAGFAFGIDRLVAILAGEDNIREVIAFPKTQSGADPLTGAPAPLDPQQLKELGLAVLPRKQ